MKPIINYCQENGIVVEAYSSLAPITTYPGGPVDIPITAAALRLGITPTQVIFLWVRAKGAVIVTTTSNKERMKEYLAVNDLPPTSLTHEEIAAIDHAGANGPPPGPGPSQSEFTSFLSSSSSSSFHLSPLSRILSSLSSWSSPSPPKDASLDVDLEKSPLVLPLPPSYPTTTQTPPMRHPPTKITLVGVITILLLSITSILGIVLVLGGLLC
ncbi:hypothetical protein D9758_017525 [Tetrapyrgos nigripes]|uniref:NADP-dependent oxidoreductase domain-containing protein n=1 Tax=Tetrapyrgos nigripes TaxID=182062 RepID=A0A8H5C2I5_9AGAR|nr:hypothetical protein D9758_017525 [Tetrapyrgos nigripes]